MRKQTKKNLTIAGVIILILGLLVVLAIFGKNLFSITNQDFTAYKTVNYGMNSITYSDIIPDYNYARTHNVFAQYNGGNINSFIPFYNNLGFLSIYLDNALIVNSGDFEILAGDGGSMTYGCHLKPNYCQKPSGDRAEFVRMDDDGCPIYNVFTRTSSCCCYSTNRVCNDPTLSPPGCKPAGSVWSSWVDCSDFTLTQSNVGGSTKTTNYKSILENDGWSWNNEYSCWQKSDPTESKINELMNKMSCLASGNYEDGTDYSKIGTIHWYGNNGFSCDVQGDSRKITSGSVTFSIGSSQECPSGQTKCSDGVCRTSCGGQGACSFDSDCNQNVCFGQKCVNNECVQNLGMPSPKCSESIWQDYPSCSYDDSKCPLPLWILIIGGFILGSIIGAIIFVIFRVVKSIKYGR